MKAPAESQIGAELQWHRIRLIQNPLIRNGLALLVVAYLFWSVGSLELEWQRVANGLPRAVKMITRMVPPDFGRWQLLIRGVLESVQMALAASFLGMIVAVPLGICGAGNLVPRPVYLVARTFIILSRTFHEIIVAILFVKIFGFGPLAGVLTLTVGSTSFISKMLAEDIENMTSGQLEAIRATGA
ncbi:MAG: ABC transporter permease subunit, partial [Desulfobacteraceae bacterium]